MDKWLSQLMDNKKGINNKNVKQLLENDYLLIHCLTRWIDNRSRPLWEKKKMCWVYHQIMIKQNQATHLPISVVSHIKKLMKTTIFFWKNINSCRIFQILQKEC